MTLFTEYCRDNALKNIFHRLNPEIIWDDDLKKWKTKDGRYFKTHKEAEGS